MSKTPWIVRLTGSSAGHHLVNAATAIDAAKVVVAHLKARGNKIPAGSWDCAAWSSDGDYLGTDRLLVAYFGKIETVRL